MSKGSVDNKIKDGALGVLPAKATGIFGAVGVCSNPTNGIIILTDPEDANEKLGGGPLRDVVCQALAMAKTTVYVKGIAGSTPGTIGSVTHVGTGGGTLTMSGNPKNEYKVVVKIVTGGGLNVAVAVISVDGVETKRFTIPTDGVYTLTYTGLTFTFAVADEATFVEGDTYSFETTAPKASNAEILAGVDELLDSNYDYEFIAVSGVSDTTLWAALATKAESAATSRYRYIHFKCQGRYLSSSETLDGWVGALTGTERGLTVGGRVQVCVAWVESSDAITGEVDRRPGLGWCCGMSAQKDIHEPVDHVGSSALSGITKILPEGMNDGHINALDNAGYVTFCQYIGKTGVYITHGRMFAEATSDYGLEERRRVMDYACKTVRLVQLDYINSTVAIGADGSIEGLDMFKAISANVLNEMKKIGQISGYEIDIDPTQNILSTETLRTKIRIVPLGKMTFIENEISYKNPVLG